MREVFDLGDTLLFVVSDRLSAFDVILPDPIPYKGAVLNQISAFWFQKLDFARNHFITADFDEFPQSLRGFRDQLAGRSMLVKKDGAALDRMCCPRLPCWFRLEGLPANRVASAA